MRNKIKIITLSIFLFCTLFTNVFAQKDKIRFGHLFLEDERWQERVYDILQDKQGFMWFGTRDGLYKYDG